jgi:carboxyl-terminal processing protease
VRISSARFSIVSIAVLTAGMLLSFLRFHTNFGKATGGVKSVDQYWSDTGLEAKSLEELIQDDTCASSERYFLACINSLISIANRFNKTIDIDGEIISVDASLSDQLNSEKKQLQVWKLYYQREVAQARSEDPLYKQGAKISFSKMWAELKTKYISNSQKAFMVGVGLNGFISVFRDPHTYLVPVALFKEVISKSDNKSNSLGMSVGRLHNRYVVRKVLEGSSAKKAGLQRGDFLFEIDGHSTKNLLQVHLYEMFKGDLGTIVKIKILRGNKEIIFDLVRSETTVASVSTRVVDGIKPVAIIGLNKFAKGSCQRVKDAVLVVKKAKVRGLILDLRDNPGGQMEEAACIASLFLGPEKKIFEVKYLDMTKKSETFYGSEEKVFDLPLAVLVNAGSASAAEIVAGALQDFKRSLLVGERTFGKGSFQEGEYWTQNKKIALFETKGFYYLPSGRSVQLIGLTPDVPVVFDKIDVSREGDQFMNPLLPLDHKIDFHKNIVSTKDCLEVTDPSGPDDIQIASATRVLFCRKSYAEVSR